ncbi:hypothetical protein C8J57DRAFT_1736111 [Mycena rebaudengoi]|nr:hypothetical protein C8J57DRAFT_1736111 [Mycena rebaudengoi]
MKFPSKASSLESCADVAPHTFQLVVMLFVAVAAAVPTEMLKREPAVPLNRRPGALFHCNALCVPADCGDRPVTVRDCFGNACACGD